MAAEVGFYSCTGPDEEELEKELSAIESRAAFALRSYLEQPSGARGEIGKDLAIFFAWLGARVPAFRRVLEDGWSDFVYQAKWGDGDLPPADETSITLVNTNTGESRRETVEQALGLLRSKHWTTVLEQERYVDLLRVQAWYFAKKHLPGLAWILLTAPPGASFVTSDRPLVWFVPDKEFGDVPAALGHTTVEVTVPVDARHALLGLSKDAPVPASVTPAQINFRTAYYAERFVCGPSADVVTAALDSLVDPIESL